MKYSEENLMHLLGKTMQTLRGQTFGGGDRRTMFREEDRRGRFGGREFPGGDDRWERPFGRRDGHGPMEGFPGRGRGFGGPERREGPMDRRAPFARERILRFIGEQEPISQNHLSELLGIRPQSLSETLKKLEQDGYIRRTKNEADKRETLVTLTDAGRQRQEEVKAARAEQLEAFLAPLTEEERRHLFYLLVKLTGTEMEAGEE